MSKPLGDVRILDLTHMLSGPYAGMLLADLGAETIKVEPLAGEGTRKLLATDPANSIDGMGAYFLTLNRNKQSVAIDLKSPEGRQVFYSLVKSADVVLSNFGAGVCERLEIDHAALSAINPRIITCSISGFGSDGPGCKRPSFDLVAQAIGGGMSITGADSNSQVRAGIPIGDLGGGMFAVMGILTALHERNASGLGQHVDISMVDCQISLLNYMATMYFLSGEDPHAIGNSHFVHVPYGTFTCADGDIVIAVITDNFWQSLKHLVQVPAFDDERYDTQPGRWADRDFINRTLNEVLSAEPVAYWQQQLERAGIPCAPVNRLSQALSDAQVQHRNMVVEIAHPNGKTTRAPGNPIKLSRTAADSYSPAPLLGSDTDRVLTELGGLSAEAVAQLRAQGVVK